MFLNFWTGLLSHKEKVTATSEKKSALPAGFEPTRGDPIGFQVQRLNHSATTACKLLDLVKFCLDFGSFGLLAFRLLVFLRLLLWVFV